ncbi:MAG: PEGA domain-containing protein [Planctomycetes bacterium]|nr:PEGA domain-containing protein [Planctomycetota bacterium]
MFSIRIRAATGARMPPAIPMSHASQISAKIIMTVAVAAIAACGVDRRLRIHSNPDDCEVSVDGKMIGKAPIEYHFTHYGSHRIYLSKKGYKSVERDIDVDAPWYGEFPFDIFSEVLIPIWRRDFRDVEFGLALQNEAQTEAERVALETENRRLEEDAVAHVKQFRRWAPGEPPPEIRKPASAPAKP